MAQYYPWRIFAQRWLRRGELPLWNPHQFCGMPFVGNAQSAVFYPPNLLFWVGDVATAFGLLAVLRLFAAGAFTFLLARTVGMRRSAALFAAAAYAFCGFMVTWTALPTLVDVAMWLPWVLWSLELIFRGRYLAGTAALGFGLGMQFLAGHPHMSLYVLMAVGVRALIGLLALRVEARLAPVCWVGVGAVLGVGLGACQLLPTAELSRYSHRFQQGTRPTPLGRANPQALPWEHLSLLVSPRLLGDPNAGTYYGFAWARGNYADYCGYVGVATLVLAALGVALNRGMATWIALTGLGFLLAVNPYPIAWLMARSGITGAALGSPTRAFVLFSLGVAMLGGWGVHRLGESAAHRRRTDAVVVPWTLALFSGLLGLQGLVNGTLHAAAGPGVAAFAAPLQTMGLIAAGFLLAATLFLIASCTSGRLSAPIARGVLLAVLFVDLAWFGYGYNPSGRRGDVYPSTPALSWLQRRAPEGRIMALNRHWSLTEYPRGCLPPNGAMVYGLDDIAGYDSLHLARYKDLAARLEGDHPCPPENGNMILLSRHSSPLVPALGVTHIVSRGPLEVDSALLVATDGETHVYHVPNALPRAFLLPTSAAGSIGGRLEGLSAWRAAVVPLSPERPSPNCVRVVGNELTDGTLVLTDVAFPGWRATVDGRLANVVTRFDLFRAVDAPAGVRRAEFVYWPQSVRLGLFLSLLALAVIAAFLARSACRTPGK